MRLKLFILTQVLMFLPFFAGKGLADVLYLKNGRKLEGIVKREDAQYIELEVSSGTVKFQKNEVMGVEKVSDEKAGLMRQKWESQKEELAKKIAEQKLLEESKPKRAEFLIAGQNMVVKALLDKKVEVLLILDTGASLVMIRKSTAKELGINLDKVKPDMKCTLADGRQVGAKRVLLKSIKVQNTEAQDVEAAVLLDEIGDIGGGLLGMSFLRKFNFKIDQKEKKLILEKI